ncbi:MAG TPA: hypothetical protein VJQ78_11600 [Sphingobium sp.]|nr:hypothetical protein [Sphingobium sp.]
MDGLSFDRNAQGRAFTTLGACSALMLMLAACESTGTTRFASVGAGSGGGGASQGSGGGSGSGSASGGGTATDGGGAGTGSGSGSGTGSGTGVTGGGSGSGSVSGSGGTSTAALGQLSPALVTAGNAVLGVSDGQGGVTTPVATALPVLQPVTGTITRVLTDTGTVLVDAGQGRTLLLQGAQGVVGDLVTIDVGGHSVTTGLDGTAGAIGVGVLGSTQPVGTVATAGVLNAGNTVLADVNGVADVRVTNITSPTGGLSQNLLDVALTGNQVIGNGSPALIEANLLPGGAALPGTGGALAPVQSAVQSVGQTVDQVTGGALAPVTAAAGIGATAGSASVDAGATATTGGALAPVTGVVSGTVNSLTSGLGLTQP